MSLAALPAIARGVWSKPRAFARRSKEAQTGHQRMLLVVQLIYVALIGVWLLRTGNWPTPDQIGIAMFAFAVLTSRGFAFLRDWSPFIILVLSYEALRGVADGLVANTHVQFAINADRFLTFGHIPTVELQNALWDPNHLHWYDYVAAFMHPMHFIVPLALGFVLWMRSRPLYWKFMFSYLLLTYAGFITYLLFPAAPPWYAAALGRIPPVDQILGQVLWRHSVSQPIVLAYGYFDPNPVAAIPSLHAAFPVLVWLIIWKLRPRWGWATVVYPLLMDFAVIYLGEHYLIDVLLGTLYGAVAYAVVWEVPEWWARLQRRRSGGAPALGIEGRDLVAHPAYAAQTGAGDHGLGLIEEDRSVTPLTAQEGGGVNFGRQLLACVPLEAGHGQRGAAFANPATAEEAAVQAFHVSKDEHRRIPPG